MEGFQQGRASGIGVVAVLLSACAMLPVDERAELTGTATYRERMALPDGAAFSATLENVSRADAKAEILGATRFTLQSGPPIEFAIPYDPREIDASLRYALRARIEHDDRLLFTTDTHYPVLTQGAPDTVNLLLKRVPSRSASSVTRRQEVIYGMYSYTADAGLFVECTGGSRLPVAEEGDNAALQSAYIEAAPGPNASLLAAVEGRIEERQPMEGDARPTLIVDRFINIKPGSCDEGTTASLENTYWKVTAIRGEAVRVPARQREPHIILHPADKRVSGRGGCNSLVGNYETRGGQIRFLRMAGTMMACPEGMEQEQAMYQALGTVVRWRISGERLELMDDNDTVVLELESRYLY